MATRPALSSRQYLGAPDRHAFDVAALRAADDDDDDDDDDDPDDHLDGDDDDDDDEDDAVKVRAAAAAAVAAARDAREDVNESLYDPNLDDEDEEWVERVLLADGDDDADADAEMTDAAGTASASASASAMGTVVSCAACFAALSYRASPLGKGEWTWSAKRVVNCAVPAKHETGSDGTQVVMCASCGAEVGTRTRDGVVVFTGVIPSTDARDL